MPSAGQLRQTLTSKNVYERRRAKLLLQRLQRDGNLPTSYPYPVQAWQFGRVGDRNALTFVALGGEVVVDYSLVLKRALGREQTFVAAYCNDVMAYIPSRRIWHEGGYEGGGSMVYYGQPSRWAESVEDTVIAAVRRVVATAATRM